MTTMVTGCLIRKAASAVMTRKIAPILQLFPAKSPIDRGLSRKTQDPWSLGRATWRRNKLLFLILVVIGLSEFISPDYIAGLVIYPGIS